MPPEGRLPACCVQCSRPEAYAVESPDSSARQYAGVSPVNRCHHAAAAPWECRGCAVNMRQRHTGMECRGCAVNMRQQRHGVQGWSCQHAAATPRSAGVELSTCGSSTRECRGCAVSILLQHRGEQACAQLSPPAAVARWGAGVGAACGHAAVQVAARGCVCVCANTCVFVAAAVAHTQPALGPKGIMVVGPPRQRCPKASGGPAPALCALDSPSPAV
jgi:hypothetical protein